MLKTLRLLVSDALFASARLVLQGVSTGAVAPSLRAHRQCRSGSVDRGVFSHETRNRGGMSKGCFETVCFVSHRFGCFGGVRFAGFRVESFGCCVCFGCLWVFGSVMFRVRQGLRSVGFQTQVFVPIGVGTGVCDSELVIRVFLLSVSVCRLPWRGRQSWRPGSA
jgi:hypothetical protein